MCTQGRSERQEQGNESQAGRLRHDLGLGLEDCGRVGYFSNQSPSSRGGH